ncbi:alpha/beta hydrolase [Paeniglutamicibacter cryotolerans]|uniref:Acetyl esterase/lipase n=1 Tax=Paeniglutamicibacter cryotolerans TaxID=670079 RepID=A0A839QGH8_9MICC|nr:acetyl esterase/lipase [Paeniglutamicibacter cryotolerans]
MALALSLPLSASALATASELPAGIQCPDTSAKASLPCGRTPVRSFTDIVYSSPGIGAAGRFDLEFDLLVPDSPGPKPLVVYLPGGGFLYANRTAALPRRTYLAEAGFVVASVKYRTVTDGASYLEGVRDVKAAIRYLRAHAAELSIDPERVAVWGESAGGYMAAMAGTTGGVERFEAGGNLDQDSSVDAVIDVYGTSDLPRVAADFDAATRAVKGAAGSPHALWLFGPGSTKALAEDPAAAAAASPLTYASAGDPPFLMFHGAKDKTVSPSQTRILQDALLAAGVPSTRYVLPNAGHGSPKAAWNSTVLMDTMIRFLREKLG